MKEITQTIIVFLLILIGCSCNRNRISIRSNADFLDQLNAYIAYLDSTNSNRSQFDYIVVEAIHKNNSTEICFWYSDGFYTLVYHKSEIRDLINYNNHHILFIGDFPNCIVKIKFKNSLEVIEEIGSKYYKEEYADYKKDPHLISPTMNDYMSLNIKFIDCELASVKREYY